MTAAPIPRPVRRLQAARIVAGTVLGVLGAQIVADIHPDSFLGATDRLLAFGTIYCLLAALAAVPIALGLLAAQRWAVVAGPLLLAVHVGVGVPMLTHDVQIGGVVILWNLLVIGHGLFAVKGKPPRTPRGRQPGEDEAWLQRQGGACQHLLFASLLATVAVLGYPLGGIVVPGLLALGLAAGTLAMAAPFAIQLLRRRLRPTIALAVLVALWAPAAVGSLASTLGLLWFLQAGVLVALLTRGPVFADLLRSFYSRPALLILTTFALLALSGAAILTFPAASADGRPIAFLDALFTATSATCVTGLIVLDTPVAFSSFGHLVIAALIQLGGLGIMVFSTFAAVLLGGRLALKSEQALEEVLDLSSPGSAYELTRFIVVSTLVIEALGAGLLAALFHDHGLAWDEALWRGAFHSVSAFCNAGFSLWSDSLIQFQRDAAVQGVHAALITLGGLGFPVLAALWLRARGSKRRLPLQARIVLVISLALVVLGALLYALAEWDATLAGMSTADKLVNAAFQSVSLRTAGFNSVDFAALERSTILMMIVWMFIGASPGSTGGGIKTTTLAVVLAAIPALIRDQPRATLMRRTMPHDVVYRAATIMTIATMVAIVVTYALLASHDLDLGRAAFEVVSALATVGLSIGATAELGAFGKWLIILTMFVGRVGPVSLALALGTPRSAHVAFPESKLMVG